MSTDSVATLKRRRATVLWVVCVAGTVIPVAILLRLVDIHSVNVPFLDEWIYVDLREQLHHGRLGIEDLWAQQNEHRILFPKIVELTIIEITDWNTRVETFLSVIVASASFAFLVNLLRRTFLGHPIIFGVFTVSAAWLFFSPIAFENWLFGFQSSWYIGLFFVILTIWLLARSPDVSNVTLIVAMAACTLATYSFGGLIVWPLAVPILLYWRVSRQKLALWSSVGAIVTASYLYDFRRPSTSLSYGELLRHPTDLARFALGYLGRTVATTPARAQFAGAVMLAALLVAAMAIHRRGKLHDVVAWLALAVYVVMTAMLAAASRLSFGIEQSQASRYATISVVFVLATCVVAAYALVLCIDDWRRAGRRVLPLFLLAGALGVPAAYGVVNNYRAGIDGFEGYSLQLEAGKRCVRHAQSEDSRCLRLVSYGDKVTWANRRTAWAGIQMLRRDRLGPFSGAVANGRGGPAPRDDPG